MMMEAASNSEPTTAIDAVFVVEGSAVNGAYVSELKTNYLIPTLEFLSHGQVEDRDFGGMDPYATQYAVVLYTTSCTSMEPCSRTYGPFTSSAKVLDCIERLQLQGSGMEALANLSEGLATAHDCFDDLHEERQMKLPPSQYNKEPSINVQKYCILFCNSPPYMRPISESRKHKGKSGNFQPPPPFLLVL